MRLTSFTDYGLRMLMRMASAPERAFSTADLADEYGLSRNHLAKIMQRLAQAGLVETRRGGGGGAALARPASEIRIGVVVRLLEDGQPLVECLSEHGGACTIDGRCRAQGAHAFRGGRIPRRPRSRDARRYRARANTNGLTDNQPGGRHRRVRETRNQRREGPPDDHMAPHPEDRNSTGGL